MKPFSRSIPLMSLALILSIFVSACGIFDMPLESGAILFQDDFASPASGWDRYQDEFYTSDYNEGQYRIAVHAPLTDAWSNPRLDFHDTRTELDATKLSGPDDNVYGLLCRYQDPLNFYFALISSDGYVGIGLSKEGRRQLLSSDTMLPSEALVRGQATNHLRFDCVGFDLKMYVNGTLVAEAMAAEWAHGDVGLIAGTYNDPGAEVAFDNFSVRNP